MYNVCRRDFVLKKCNDTHAIVLHIVHMPAAFILGVLSFAYILLDIRDEENVRRRLYFLNLQVLKPKTDDVYTLLYTTRCTGLYAASRI